MELDVMDVIEECARLRDRLTQAERIVEMARVDGAAQSQRRIERLERENNLLREMAYGMSVALRVGDEVEQMGQTDVGT